MFKLRPDQNIEFAWQKQLTCDVLVFEPLGATYLTQKYAFCKYAIHPHGSAYHRIAPSLLLASY